MSTTTYSYELLIILRERFVSYICTFLDLQDLWILTSARKIEYCVFLRLSYEIYTRSWGWLSLKPGKERSPTEHSDTFIECCKNLVKFAIVLEYLRMKLGMSQMPYLQQLTISSFSRPLVTS